MENCNRCHKPIGNPVITRQGKTSTMCQRCYDDTARRNAELYQRTAEAAAKVPEGIKLCRRCRLPKPLKDFGIEDGRRRHVYDALNSNTCAVCRKYGAQKAKEIRARWTPEKMRAEKAEKVEYHRSQRLKLLAAYGDRCACCKETTPEFLAVDHVNNDGHLHRKVVGYDIAAMYRWAKKHNFPDTLQILCHNCNLAKAFYGRCPHQSV
jgi:hypothetical protein